MTCERVRAQLTSYLDGELDGDAGTVVRGHLRTCEGCRATAADEATLRDGLRSLPPLEPPASMWAGVQARLAAEEVAESKRPSWRRALARWGHWLPTPRVAVAGAFVAAAAIGVIYWKTRPPAEDAPQLVRTIEVPMPKIAPDVPKAPPKPNCTTVADADDVTLDLELDAKRAAAAYDCAIQELLTEAARVRSEWSDTQRSAFDDRVRSMRDAIAKAGDGKPRKRASSALVSYLQGAVAREQILLAGAP
jgi:negative regulator of sigma E activity